MLSGVRNGTFIAKHAMKKFTLVLIDCPHSIETLRRKEMNVALGFLIQLIAGDELRAHRWFNLKRFLTTGECWSGSSTRAGFTCKAKESFRLAVSVMVILPFQTVWVLTWKALDATGRAYRMGSSGVLTLTTTLYWILMWKNQLFPWLPYASDTTTVFDGLLTRSGIYLQDRKFKNI